MINTNNHLKTPDHQTVEILTKESDLLKDTKKLRKKFFAGHVNSLPNSKNYSYESSKSGAMGKQMVKALESLPEEMSAHISCNDKEALTKAFQSIFSANAGDIAEGKLVMLPLGFKGHTIYLVFCNGYLAICNSGTGAEEPFFRKAQTVKAFKINLELLTPAICMEMLEAGIKSPRKALAFYQETLPTLLSSENKPIKDEVCKQLESLSAKKQKIGNCSFAQAKLGARVGLAMLQIKKDENGISHIAKEDVKKAKAFSKDLSSHIRLKSLDGYLSKYEDGEYDASFVDTIYRKIKKRFDVIPKIALYSSFNNWKSKIEEYCFQADLKKTWVLSLI